MKINTITSQDRKIPKLTLAVAYHHLKVEKSKRSVL